MGYYQGDHYRSRRFAGDYYRGDPGFFSFIGSALKGLGGIVRKALPLVPGVGQVFSAALDIRNALQRKGVPLPPASAGTGLIPYGGGALATPILEGLEAAPGVGVMAPGGGIITQSPMGTPVHPAAIAMQMARLRHTHPNKSTYVTRGGGTSRYPPGLMVHPKGTELVASRRMNVGNARALRRALRRARGFAKLAHKVLRATHQFKGKGFGRAKARRK